MAAKSDAPGSSQRPYWRLAVLLLVGLIIALLWAWGEFGGIGWFTPAQADQAAGVALLVIAVVLFLLLTRVASAVGDVKRLRGILDDLDSLRSDDSEATRRRLKEGLDKLRGDEDERWRAEAGHEGQQEARLAQLASRLDKLERSAAVQAGALAAAEQAARAAQEGRRKAEDQILAAKLAADQADAALRRQEDELRSARAERERLLAEMVQLRAKPAVPKNEEADHVLLLEGIGPKYASRLNAAGIISTGQLMRSKRDWVAEQVDATPELVAEWQAMAALVRLKGVGPQWAEALARAGVLGPDDLAGRDAGDLARAIAKLHEGRKVRIVAGDATAATIQRWIDAARNKDFDKAYQ